MSNPQAVPCRVFVLVAREARVAAVIRRGPTKCVQLLKWSLRTDDVRPGQWLTGRVYERRCDLSPDGKFLIYFAQNFARPKDSGETWTAISKLPYWTALALWEKEDNANGGGVFLNNRSVYVRQETQRSKAVDVDNAFARRFQLEKFAPKHLFQSGNSECLGIYFPRLLRDGWRNESNEKKGADMEVFVWTRPSPKLPAHVLVKTATASSARRDAGLGAYLDQHDLRGVDDRAALALDQCGWADWDANGDLLFTRDGCLFRAVSEGGTYRPKLVCDLRPNRFEPVPAPPWARRWEA